MSLNEIFRALCKSSNERVFFMRVHFAAMHFCDIIVIP
jgi:hypothetical protein